MEIADLLSTLILIAAGAWIALKLALSLVSLSRFILNLIKGDFVLTNPKTGKSVKLGRHHRDGLAQEIEDVLG